MKKSIVIVLSLAFALLSCSSSDDPVGVDVDLIIPPSPVEENTEGLIFLREDEFQGKQLVVVGSEKLNFLVSFFRVLDGKTYSFDPVMNKLPIIMRDSDGSEWDVFGYAVNGPNQGKRLTLTQSLMGYWFSFGTFYPGLELYPTNSKGEHDGKTIEGDNGWLVPSNEVRSGGVGKDGIPAVSNPQFVKVNKTKYLDDDDLVIAFRVGDKIKVYPHDILDWHEIVNDSFDDFHFSVVYCPLTGTGTIWDRTINGKTTTFGVSGLLYNTNIVPYDRETDSNWSQLFDRSINGELRGQKPKNYMPLETRWSTFKKMYPEADVMTTNTGYSRNYGVYPYGAYKTNPSLIFPVKYTDNRLHAKERVLAVIINEKAKAYKFENFD